MCAGCTESVVTLDEYQQHDAVGLAGLVRKGEVQPIELLRLAVRRKDQVNPVLNAVSTALTDYAEKEIHVGLPDGPFQGVPFLLKDQIDLAGVPTRRASKLLADFVPTEDAIYVARLRAAGMVIFGKTNMPEMGLSVTTEPALTGVTRNPWNLEHSPGGSSGGSAVAVAAGMCPAASATDGGGSIRIPASCCGLFGLKPSRGRVPFGRAHGEGWGGLTAHNTVTRSVRDSAALLDILSGPAVGDPYYLDAAPGTFFRSLQMRTGKLRIGVITKPPLETPVQADCLSAVDDTIKLLAGLGHELVETRFPVSGPELREATSRIVRTKVYEAIEETVEARGTPLTKDDVEAATWVIHEAGGKTSGRDYAFAIETMHHIGRQMGDFMLDYDVLLSPTLAEPPIKLGAFNPQTIEARALFDRMRQYSPFCNIYNASGQPSMNVPLHWGAENLPIGVQFAGRFGEEVTLLKLAAQLETARPWSQRYRWLKLD